MHRQHQKFGYLAEIYTLIASFLWATSFIAVKVGLQHLDPLWFLVVRLFLAALVLLPFFLRRIRWRDYLGNTAIWSLGLLCGLGYMFQYLGMVETTASAAAFLINFGVVFVAILSWALLHEPFGWMKRLGLFIAVIGAALLSGGFDLAKLLQGDLKGNILVIVGGLFWAGYTINNKIVLDRGGVRVLPLTAMVFLLAGLWLIPAAMLLGTLPVEISLFGWGILIYMVIFCTCLPFLFWTRGLQGIAPTLSSTILLLEPVFASVLAYFLLHERFTAVELTGALSIFLAIVLVSFADVTPSTRSRRKKGAPPVFESVDAGKRGGTDTSNPVNSTT